MEGTEQAQSFVEQLANDLSRRGHLKSFDKAVIWQYFDRNVAELEDVKPELMSFLTENRQSYGKKLVRLSKRLAKNSCNMQTALSSGVKGDAHPLPYNLYASNKVKKRTVKEHYSDPCSIYSAYLSERMAHLDDSKAVLKLLKHCLNSSLNSVRGSWHREMRKLLAVASTRSEPRVLQLVMEIFNMRLSSELECGNCNDECLSDVKSSVEDFVTFCSRKHEQVGEFPKKPRFCDLLAASMSLYTDVVLLSCRNKSESDQKKEGQRLCGSVCGIFRDHPEFILDVVIQLSECRSSDGTILLPLCKKALAKPIGNVDSIFYTKYIVASCQCRRLFPELLSDVIAQVRDVAAPADYVNWLKEKNSSIPEVFPAKKHFSDFRITKFLLEKATEDLLNKLLDVLTDTNDEKLNDTRLSSENDEEGIFYFDGVSAELLQEEDMESVEPENDDEPADVEDQADIMISSDGKAVHETEIVFHFDRNSAMSPARPPVMPLEEHGKETVEQEKLHIDERGEETDDNEIKSQADMVEEVDGEFLVVNLDEDTTSAEEVVEKNSGKVTEVVSGVRGTDRVAVEISEGSEDEESREVLINRVLDCIKIGDTSDSDMFEEWEAISQKKTCNSEKKVSIEMESSIFNGGDLKNVLETSEQSLIDVETECGNKDFDCKVVEKSPQKEFKVVEKSPKKEFKVVGKSPDKEFKVVEKSPEKDFKVVEKSPDKDFKLVEKSPRKELKVVGKSPDKEFKVVEKSPEKEFKVVEKSPKKEFKVVGKSPEKEFKVVEKSPKKEFKVVEKSPKKDVVLNSSELKDETESCIGPSEANEDGIRSPDFGNTSAEKSKNKRKSADHVIMEKPISDGSNTYTALKLRHRTPDKSKKGQKSNRRESDEMSTKSPTQRCEDNDKTEVEDRSSDLVNIDDSTVLPTLSEVKIQEKIISTVLVETPDCSLKSPNHSFVESKQLQQTKSPLNSLSLPSTWSSKDIHGTFQSPSVTMERTVVADSSERGSAKSRQAKSSKNMTKSPQLPDFKKFLKSPGNATDEYEFNSDKETSPLLPYTQLVINKNPGSSSPTQLMEMMGKGCKMSEGATGSRSSISPEVFPIAHTYSSGGKRGTIRRVLLPELGDGRQNKSSDLVESPPSTPAKPERGTHDAEGRASSEDPDGHSTRRRSVRIQNKLSVAAKDCTQEILSSPVANSRKRKASASMETPKKLKS